MLVTPANVAWVTNSARHAENADAESRCNEFFLRRQHRGPVALTLNSGTQTLTKRGTSSLNGLYAYTGNTLLNGGTLVLGSGMTLPNTPRHQRRRGRRAQCFRQRPDARLRADIDRQRNGARKSDRERHAHSRRGHRDFDVQQQREFAAGQHDRDANQQIARHKQPACLCRHADFGGTLSVTNLGGSLTAGDSFRIFSAANFTGGFSALNLPPLGVGLAWNTSALTNGVLSVIATAPPQFASFAQTGDGNFHFRHRRGGRDLRLDAATNLSAANSVAFRDQQPSPIRTACSNSGICRLLISRNGFTGSLPVAVCHGLAGANPAGCRPEIRAGPAKANSPFSLPHYGACVSATG